MKSSPPSISALHLTPSNALPDVSALMAELEDIVVQTSTWLAQQQDNERTMLALWEGQSDDGRKWDKNYDRPVAPFDGCSDVRNRLTDSSVDELTMLQVSAVFDAEPQAIQQEASDASTAGKVGTLLKYEIRQRMHSELWEETNYLAAWLNTCGHAVMWTRWMDSWMNGEETITQDQLIGWLAEQQMAQMPDLPQDDPAIDQGILEQSTLMAEAIMARPASDPSSIAILQARYPALSEKRATKVLADLRRTGTATFRLPIKRPGRPSATALFPGIDIHYHWWVDKVQEAPVVYVIETLPEHKLRAKPTTEKWSQEFVDAMIAMGPTACMEMGTVAKIGRLHTEKRHHFDTSASNRINAKMHEMRSYYQVVRAFVRSVDEDGFEAMHEVIYHPSAGTKKGRKAKPEPLVALSRLVDDYHDGGCFVGFRREYKTRKIHESRGVPELGMSAQFMLKKSRDASIDRSDLATSPPVRTNIRMGKGERLGDLGIRPGGRVYDQRGEKTEWMTPPAYDAAARESDQAVLLEHANLLGLDYEGISPNKLMLHRQYIVRGFLVQYREVLLRILSLDQRYMDPLFVSRVIGTGDQPFEVSRAEIAGQFDVNLKFDVRMLDIDYVKARWNVVREAMANDRSGVMRDPVFTKWVVASIDPALADMGFDDPKTAVDKDIKELQSLLSSGMNGFYGQPKDGGNAQALLAEIDKQLATNPRMYSAMQEDPTFAQYVQSLRQKYEFDLKQFENAETGRSGWTFDDAEQKAGIGRGMA